MLVFCGILKFGCNRCGLCRANLYPDSALGSIYIYCVLSSFGSQILDLSFFVFLYHWVRRAS